MKRFVEGEDRRQATLLPECLDDYVTQDNPVRVIEVFIDELDLGAVGFAGVVPEATGRPAYHPATLLKVYLYGYLNRIQSSRRLERETQRKIELMWLTGRLMPDFKTIADFRRDNGPAIRAACAHFVVLCRQFNLFTRAVVAIDGSKFKAVNTRDKNFTVTKVAKRVEQVEASIARYLAALDRADRQDDDVAEAKTARLKEKIEGLRRQMQSLREMGKQVEAAPDKQVSLTDPEARSMATSGKGTGIVGYNVQMAVDAEHHLIVAHEVTNIGSDRAQLTSMGQQALDATGCEEITVLADRGYYSGDEVLACEGTGILPCIRPRLVGVGANADRRTSSAIRFRCDLSTGERRADLEDTSRPGRRHLVLDSLQRGEGNGREQGSGGRRARACIRKARRRSGQALIDLMQTGACGMEAFNRRGRSRKWKSNIKTVTSVSFPAIRWSAA